MEARVDFHTPMEIVVDEEALQDGDAVRPAHGIALTIARMLSLQADCGRTRRRFECLNLASSMISHFLKTFLESTSVTVHNAHILIRI
jgi:hypothetical protein